MKIRKTYISGIKQRVIVDVTLKTPKKKLYKVRGYSSFSVEEGNIGKKRLIINAMFNGFYTGMNRYKLPTGTDIINLKLIGFQSHELVNVKRVNVKGKYRTFVFVKGKRGIQKNIKWSSRGIDDNLIDEISDEFGVGEWRE